MPLSFEYVLVSSVLAVIPIRHVSRKTRLRLHLQYTCSTLLTVADSATDSGVGSRGQWWDELVAQVWRVENKLDPETNYCLCSFFR